MMIDVVVLDALELDASSGVPLAKASQPATGDDDAEPFGDVPLMQCLGISSAPYPAGADGFCEAVVAVGVGGRDAVCVGARDTRTAKLIGNMKPGDTVVHSTGPEQAAQLQLKEAKRQAVLVTKGTDGKQVLLALDGKSDKVTIAAFGGVFEMTKDAISMFHPNGTSGLVIGPDGVRIVGQLMLNTPTGALMLAAGTAAQIAAIGNGGTPVGLVPAKGIFPG